MTTAPEMPASGGTYIRHPDGSLTRVEDVAPTIAPAADTPAEEPAEAPAKPATKSTVKGV